MTELKNYLPVGSVVLLKGATKKTVIMGIMQNIVDENKVTEYDYIGVMYPEGFLGRDSMIFFNHDAITDVIYKGYDNPERVELFEKLEANIDKIRAKLDVK